MKKETSNTITNINVILTILIVLLHSNCIKYANVFEESYVFVNFINFFLVAICSIAVPTFFAISSFLFFRNFEMLKYRKKMKNRIYSLVIPYLFFSIIFLLYTIILTNISFLKDIETTMEPIKYNFISFIKYIFLAEFNGPLWYMRNLFFYCAFSPIIFMLIKYLKKYNWIIIIGIFFINIVYSASYYGLLYWLFIYYLVAYLTLNNNIDKIYKIIKRWKPLILIIGIIFLILLIIYNENQIIYYIFRMFSPLILFTICYKNKYVERQPPSIAKYSFFIYCTHYNIAIALKRILILFFGTNPMLLLFFQFLTCGFTIFIIIFIFKIINKLFPKCTKLILGGRI